MSGVPAADRCRLHISLHVRFEFVLLTAQLTDLRNLKQ